MLVKANFYCKDFLVTGSVDIPKIKKRLCRKHFGLLAILNHPKLSLDWFSVRKEVIVVHDAKVYDFDQNLLHETESLGLNPASIICAYEEDPKELANYLNTPMKPANENAQVCLEAEVGFTFKGEFIPDVNEVGVSRGKGFITVSGAMVASPDEPSVTQLPFIAINSYHVDALKEVPAFMQSAEAGHPLRKTA